MVWALPGVIALQSDNKQKTYGGRSMHSTKTVYCGQRARILLVFCLLLYLAACSVTPYRADTSVQAAIEARAVTQTEGDFTVRASVPSNEEARSLFDAPIHKRGIQAVWLEIENRSVRRARFAPFGKVATLDPLGNGVGAQRCSP